MNKITSKSTFNTVTHLILLVLTTDTQKCFVFNTFFRFQPHTLTWYGYNVTPPLFLLLPLLLGLFVPATACCWPAGFPRQGDPFLLSPPPPPASPRELGLEPSLCPEPWTCEFDAAQLDVCPAEGLPWLSPGGP